MIPTLTTERLTLRGYQRADFTPYCDLMTSHRSVHMGGPLDAEKAWYWFCNDTASWALFGFGTLAIVKDGEPIGFAGFVQPPNFPEPECGWGLYAGFEGQGYATEAARAILDHVFSTTDLQTCVSYVDPANAGSAAVATRLGGKIDPDATGPFGQDNLIFRHHPKGAAA